jgi:hypothetical protein
MKKTVLYFIAAVFIFLFFNSANAQTTAFNYQGKLQDNGQAANGTYQFEFKLFDAAVGGNQIGQTIGNLPATVTNGIFAVQLDFGASSFDGAPRYLEISVRQSNGGQNYTLLTPRQPVTSTPYAVRSLNAQTAQTAEVSSNSIRLGSLPASEYVQTTDTRLSDERSPLPGSANYIQNTTGAQANSNFNVSGEGKANILTAATQFNLGANRILSNPGTGNLFAGVETGAANTTGQSNAFFGAFAGKSNTTGTFNSFFGRNAGAANTSGNFNTFLGLNAGLNNTTGLRNVFVGAESGQNNVDGADNSFFGTSAGKANQTGNANSFFGRNAGTGNTASFNSFFGANSGAANLTGADNSFFGQAAGFKNTDGGFNSFYGSGAGLNNLTGARNTFFGYLSGASNTTENDNTFLGYRANGAAGITNATAIGANSVVTESNTMVLGTNIVTVRVPGSLAVAGTFSANVLNSQTVYQIAGSRVFHITGTENTFVGTESGNAIGSGSFNAFFGALAGKSNTTGLNNTFVGAYAGRGNVAGTNNAFFGANAGLGTTASFNSFFGSGAGLGNINGANNSFFGSASGMNNTNGQNNSFFGYRSGEFIGNGNNNTFIGALSGATSGAPDITGNTGIGYNVRFGAGVSNSVGIGANFTINTSNTVRIGNTSDTVELGNVSANQIQTGKITATFGTSVFPKILTDEVATGKLTVTDEIYTNELTFQFNGFGNETRLPLCYVQIAFSYKLAPCEPNLQKTDAVAATSVVSDESFKAQQAQIELLRQQITLQQAQIEQLKTLVCAQNPNAPVCAEAVKTSAEKEKQQ